jgi:phage-related protein
MRLATGVLVLAALALGACGESDEEKAMNTVCDAKDDMAKQVDELKKLTPATFTTDAVTENLKAIRTDLKDISDAQADLSDDRRSEVEAATTEFTASVRAVAKDLGTSLSASDAKTQLADALQQLGASYQETIAPLDCG